MVSRDTETQALAPVAPAVFDIPPGHARMSLCLHTCSQPTMRTGHSPPPFPPSLAVFGSSTPETCPQAGLTRADRHC